MCLFGLQVSSFFCAVFSLYTEGSHEENVEINPAFLFTSHLTSLESLLWLSTMKKFCIHPFTMLLCHFWLLTDYGAISE
uniref:Uncharacterized protein n=1 Tax=Arundo donax TaxID=35708 RepID=A0A0A9GIY6_ARUDO